MILRSSFHTDIPVPPVPAAVLVHKNLTSLSFFEMYHYQQGLPVPTQQRSYPVEGPAKHILTYRYLIRSPDLPSYRYLVHFLCGPVDPQKSVPGTANRSMSRVSYVLYYMRSIFMPVYKLKPIHIDYRYMYQGKLKYDAKVTLRY